MDTLKSNNTLAAIIITFSFLSFAIANTATRYALHNNLINPVLFFTYIKLTGVLVFLILGSLLYKKSFFIIKNKPMVAFRCLILAANQFSVTMALKYLPLDIFYSITFIMPILIITMGVLFLKETINLIKIIAITTGFIGVIIVVRPNVESDFKLIGVILTLIVASTGALSAIIGRKYLQDENPYSATFYVICSGFLLSLILILVDNPLNTLNIIKNEIPTIHTIIVILISGLGTIIGSSLFLKAYQNGVTNFIAPIQYTQLIWGLLFGYIIFNDKTTFTTILGASIIIIATLLNMYKNEKSS